MFGGREVGEQLTAGRLFTAIFAWCCVSVGGAGIIGAVWAGVAGHPAWVWAVIVSSVGVVLSFGATALIVRVSSMGGIAAGIAYAVKLIVTACAIVGIGRAVGASGTGLVVTLIVGEIIGLITMVIVVVRVEGPSFDPGES